MDQQTCSSFDGNRFETSWNEEEVVVSRVSCVLLWQRRQRWASRSQEIKASCRRRGHMSSNHIAGDMYLRPMGGGSGTTPRSRCLRLSGQRWGT